MDLEKIQVTKEAKIIFMGTPAFSVPVLEGLLEHYKIRAVVTQPDKRVGREQKIKMPPVKEKALQNTILVLQPEKLEDIFDELKALQPDLIITCAYGKILPKEVLDLPKYGCINVHASLLPKLRGGAPIHHAIIDGYKHTGITIMHMSAKMDAGDIICQKSIPIADIDTASSLHDKLSQLGKELLLEILPSILNQTAPRTKQDASAVTYGFNITREDEKIDFNNSKRQIYNQIRGLNSWPGAYCNFNGKVIKVWESYPTDNIYPTALNGEIVKIYEDGIGVKVDNGEIVFTVIQPEGKTKMRAVDFANGILNKEPLVGKIFG